MHTDRIGYTDICSLISDIARVWMNNYITGQRGRAQMISQSTTFIVLGFNRFSLPVTVPRPRNGSIVCANGTRNNSSNVRCCIKPCSDASSSLAKLACLAGQFSELVCPRGSTSSTRAERFSRASVVITSLAKIYARCYYSVVAEVSL